MSTFEWLTVVTCLVVDSCHLHGCHLYGRWQLSPVSVCVYTHIVVRSNSCENVVLQGCGKLRGLISYFLATRSQFTVVTCMVVDSCRLYGCHLYGRWQLSPVRSLLLSVCVACWGDRCYELCVMCLLCNSVYCYVHMYVCVTVCV